MEFPGAYKIILSTDDPQFGGFNRVDTKAKHFSAAEFHAGRNNFIQCYLPSRTAFVFAIIDQ